MNSQFHSSNSDSNGVGVSGDTKPLVLVVDDEEPLLALAKMMLQAQGYRVIIFSDPLEALQEFGKRFAEIELVLLDFAMPGMDGSVLFERMREICPEVKAILISGYAEDESIASMLDHGLKGYIPKPYTSQSLSEGIKAVLAPGA